MIGRGSVMSLRELEPQLMALTSAEKAQALQWLASELTQVWPGIEKTPSICGGDACIVRTRIPVWTLEQDRRMGWSEARILENYPTLTAADLVNAWAYVSAHQGEIEQAIRENEED
jgi:uncharacterized protein (DUF433 family)